MGKYRGLVLVLILSLGLVIPGAGWAAAPDDEALVHKAKADLDKENYEEALQSLTEAWQKGAHTAEKAFLLGKAYRATLDFKKGRNYLEEALRLKPNFPEARLLLADTLVALGQLTQAREELTRLEATGYEPGQTALLQGIISEREKQYSQALDYFRKAAEDPKVAQEAKFHLGQVLASQNQWTESKKALTEAIRLAPETATAEVSQRYMNAMEKLAAGQRPYHVTVSSSFDWDSNVTLQPGSPAAASQVSGKSDWAFSQSVTSEYTLFPTGPFSILGTYTYFQNFHPKLTTYDIMSHAVGLSPTYEFKSGRLWVPLFYNYTDVASDKYYTAFSVTPLYLHMLSANVGLEAGARFIRKYYWSQIYFPEDNRSAKTPGGSLGLYYFFKNQTGYVQARFTYEHDFTLGNNWDNSNYRFYVGVLYPFTQRFKVTAFMDFILQPYTNKFFDPNLNIYTSPRNDQVAVFGLQGTYNIWKGLDANLHYFYVRDASNKALYDYNRHIIGAQLAYRY
jgi:tetratricopeptide (TPR) repeat protein